MSDFQRKRRRPQTDAQTGPARTARLTAPRAKRLLRPSQQGTPLDRETRSWAESQLGHGFEGVRVHTGPGAAASAAELHAAAYTVGADIVFGAGAYEPGTGEGRALLAHELAHVVQQAGRAGSALRLAPAEGSLEQQAAEAARGAKRPTVPAAAASGLIQRDVLPVQRFSPAPGIILDRSDRSVTITGAMELYGAEATAARAASVQSSINSTWTQTFPDGYSVSCTITVTYRGAGSSAGAATQIEAEKTAAPSHVSGGEGSRSMTLNANESDAFTWTPAHEFGHVIGLRDRYSESIMSQIRGQFGGTRTSTPEAGYETNLMAVTSGTLQSRNVADIAAENEPSPYWINDDDEVRNWVNAHSIGDINRLSTAHKLAAIRTLMGGWISDDDVSAIVRICSSVTDHAEGDAIRAGIDLLEMTSIGQRTTVRIAFRQMP